MLDSSPSSSFRRGADDGKTANGAQAIGTAATLPPLFPLGQVVSTPGAMERLLDAGVDAFALLARHGRGDWGDMSDDDLRANTEAIVTGERLLSAYELPGNGGKIWVITEADRSATTLLLPDEY